MTSNNKTDIKVSNDIIYAKTFDDAVDRWAMLSIPERLKLVEEIKRGNFNCRSAKMILKWYAQYEWIQKRQREREQVGDAING
jgi:hypothetical protein